MLRIANAPPKADPDEVEITDAMLRAGAETFYLCDLRADYAEDIVASIFEAMARASPCALESISEQRNNS